MGCRVNPEMSSQIAGGIEAVKNLDINAQDGRSSQYVDRTKSNEEPHLSPFPKLVNPPPNVPPSDDELEATLENARPTVLNSNDPEMQLAWAADALVYVGVCADNEERIAAAKPHAARSATPRIEHTLKVDAMNIVNFLADQHHPKAEFLKGMWLEWGRFGQREDKKEAFRCYSRAADRGYSRAEYRIGMLYESYNDPIKALRHYHRGVEAGDAASCYRLGMMTLRGQHGQQQDYTKAIDLIRRSANAADENAAQGAYVYGMLLARQLPQIEVPDAYLQYDEQQARMNIEKAAYLKFAKAQLKMGSAYELAALGCEFNPALSMHYNALASRQGEAEADMALSKWFLVGSEGLFPKNEELAYTYAERAAQSGLATAEFALGYFNEIGLYATTNLDKAMEWYQKAANHGNDDAVQRIDGLKKKQVLSRNDHEKVAVSRIKSQFGSMRGVRPDRFQQQQTARLDQVAESPTSAYSNGNTPQAATGYQGAWPAHPTHNTQSSLAPARGTTPYPVTPTVATAAERPASVAPYPLEDGPPKPPGPVGGFFQVQQLQHPPRPSTTLNPNVRPSSAFQWNTSPDNRPNSVAAESQYQNMNQIPYAGGPPQYGGPGGPGQKFRPATVQPYQQPPNMQSYNPQGRPPPTQRNPSGPPNMQPVQGYPPQQGALSPAPPRPMMIQSDPATPVPTPPSQQVPGQKLDIGFSAPFENRQRQYGPGRFTQGQPQDPAPNPIPNQVAPQSRPLPQPAARPPDTSAPKPPQKESGTAKPPKPKPTTAPTSSGPPPSKSKKPGKGPKTFDEMGVPATKNDSDCVSGVLEVVTPHILTPHAVCYVKR